MEHRIFKEVPPVRNLLHFKFPIFISVCTSVIIFIIYRSIIHESIIHAYLSIIIHELFINKNMCYTKSYSWETSQEFLSLKFQIKSCSYTTDIVITIKVVNTQPSKSTKSRVVKTQLLSSSFRHDQNKIK